MLITNSGSGYGCTDIGYRAVLTHIAVSDVSDDGADLFNSMFKCHIIDLKLIPVNFKDFYQIAGVPFVI